MIDDVVTALVDTFTAATADLQGVVVLDGPPGREIWDKIAIGVGITPQDNLPAVESTPTATGADSNVDEMVVVRCWLQVSEMGAEISAVRAQLTSVLGLLDNAVHSDRTLGHRVGLAWMPGVQRYFQGRTTDATFVEVFFDVTAMVYR